MKNVISIVAILLLAAVTAGLLVYFTMTGESPESLSAAESAVVINEAMSGNRGICLDDEGKSSDWVELYNPSDEAVNLSRFSLSDDGTEYDKWMFPDIVLSPHSFMVVYLSGDSKKEPASGSLHASFKLNVNGEQLILSIADNVVDSIDLPALPANISYGRVEGEWKLTENPTPGKPNGTTAG